MIRSFYSLGQTLVNTSVTFTFGQCRQFSEWYDKTNTEQKVKQIGTDVIYGIGSIALQGGVLLIAERCGYIPAGRVFSEEMFNGPLLSSSQKIVMFVFIPLATIGPNIAGPLTEELAYREVLQRNILRDKALAICPRLAPVIDSMPSRVTRVVLTAALFSVTGHSEVIFNGPNDVMKFKLLNTFILGITTGTAREYSGLSSAIAIHIVANSFFCLFRQMSMYSNPLPVIPFGLTFVGIACLIKYYKDNLREHPPGSVPPKNQ